MLFIPMKYTYIVEAPSQGNPQRAFGSVLLYEMVFNVPGKKEKFLLYSLIISKWPL